MTGSWQIGSRGVIYSFKGPVVMGIVNITPDSFYASSRVEAENAAARVAQMINDGASIVDVGAYSTRPGAGDVSQPEELQRLESCLPEIIKACAGKALVSVDTFRASVAKAALDMGADIINDISCCADPLMAEVVAHAGAPYVLMHMRGTPQTMASLCDYGETGVTATVIKELSGRLYALEEAGVRDIIIDPGFGFAKTVGQNYQLMHDLDRFHILGRPLLVGISRKSMITKLLNTKPDEALEATTALNMAALNRGASILRVHDVLPAAQTIKLHQTIFHPESVSF